MLHLFPTPYPDELFYSLVARFTARLGPLGPKQVMEAIFGSAQGTAVVDLPTRLGRFQRRLPPEHPLSAFDLIGRCTLFPLYKPFLPRMRAEIIVQRMLGDGGLQATLQAGIMAHRMNRQGLRICSQCSAEDLLTQGELYWRRQHQAPGVLVCDKHAIMLEETTVAGANRRNRQEFLLPPSVGSNVPVVFRAAQGREEHDDLLWLAQASAWLLRQAVWDVTPEPWCEAYRARLTELDFTTDSGRYGLRRIGSAFTERFRADFLNRLQCELQGHDLDTSWLARLLRRPRATQPPLQHLLLWRFLGVAPAEWILRLKSSPEQVAANREEPTELGKEQRSGVWQNLLKQRWNDPKFSLRAIARELEVEPLTAKRWAVKLGLSFPRTATRITTTAGVASLKSRRDERSKRLASDKKQWEGLIKSCPGVGVKGLRVTAPALYAALYRADRGWLRRHSPHRSVARQRVGIDWEARDGFLAEKLVAVQKQALIRTGKPIRISVAILGRAIGARAVLEKHLDKLPRCRALLATLTEDRIDFALRRLRFVAEKLRLDGIRAKQWQLLKLAGIRPELVQHPRLQEAMDILTVTGCLAKDQASPLLSQAA